MADNSDGMKMILDGIDYQQPESNNDKTADEKLEDLGNIISQAVIAEIRNNWPGAIEEVLKNRTDDFIAKKSPEIWMDFNFLRQVRKVWDIAIVPAVVVSVVLFVFSGAAKAWGII